MDCGLPYARHVSALRRRLVQFSQDAVGLRGSTVGCERGAEGRTRHRAPLGQCARTFKRPDRVGSATGLLTGQPQKKIRGIEGLHVDGRLCLCDGRIELARVVVGHGDSGVHIQRERIQFHTPL